MKNKKYTDPINCRFYRSQKDVLNRLMTNERFCRQHNIGSESDVIRLGLNKVLREYEQIEFRQQVS